MSRLFKRLAFPLLHARPCTFASLAARPVSTAALAADNVNPAPQPVLARRPYVIERSSNDTVPVYTDIRNAGSRHLVIVKNVRGNVPALVNDLRETLFEPGSAEAMRLKIQVKGTRLILSGGIRKHKVVEWLVKKGF